MTIRHPKIQAYIFLEELYQDSYFPDFLVDRGEAILVHLCEQIESQQPTDDTALYVLTHASTEAFNDLQEAFYEHDSEIETAARECIAMDFDFIVRTYGFEVDIEEVIAGRDW